jgi:hypothetical protein
MGWGCKVCNMREQVSWGAPHRHLHSWENDFAISLSLEAGPVEPVGQEWGGWGDKGTLELSWLW